MEITVEVVRHNEEKTLRITASTSYEQKTVYVEWDEFIRLSETVDSA